MESNRVALKRKPDPEFPGSSLSENMEVIKRHQYENADPSPPLHVIELVPASSSTSEIVIHNPEKETYLDDQPQQQQFIELANVAFDHHNFINVENIFHNAQPIHVQHHGGEYASGQLWNGTDLIVLENCPAMPPPPVPPMPSSSRKVHQHHQPARQYHLQANPPQNHQQLHQHLQNKAPVNPKDSEDVEDKNLSWLLNFKLDELPHLSPETKRKPLNANQNADLLTVEKTFEADDTNVAENVVIENTQKIPKKPPFTYTELIEYALEDQGELTVSGIYQWISDRFKYYKSNDDRWKNSVRHNLSINPHFRKGSKATQGAGHLWTISSRDSEVNLLAWEHKKQRLELFFKMEESHARREAESFTQEETMMATASIMQRDQPPEPRITTYHEQTYAIPEPQGAMDFENGQSELRRTAGEILNGVKRNVEVQVMHPVDTANYHSYTILESDYLNPISKEEIVQECGLRTSRRSDVGNEYYVTTIDPIELGVNMSAGGAEEIFFEDDFNFNYFGNNIMA